MPDRTIGNYVLGPVLGRGGMSVVHAAEHRFLGDRVAIKLLRSQLAGDAAATAAFIAEATRTRAIEHPGVVRVLDFGSDGDAFYLVMERLDGESLAARLLRCGRLDEAEVRRLGAAIADALAAAHDRGIVHRDLKPGNIVMAGDAPRVIDFGIAREVAAVTGSRLGTVAYMAPEQLTGGLIAPCVDIWALGVVLFEALAGRLPFDGFADGRSPQLFETAPRLGALAGASPALDTVIASCLERDPSKRPDSMRALAAALRDATPERLTEDLAPSPSRAGTPGSPEARSVAPPPSLTASAARPRRHARRMLTAAAACAVIAAGAIALASRLSHRDSRGATATRDQPAASATRDQPTTSATRDPTAAATPRDPTAAATPRDPTAAPAPRDPTAAPASAPTSVATPSPRFAVEVRSAPAGARVLLAGKRVGVTPATVVLDAPASLVVSRAGYQPRRIRAERAGAIDVRLVPVPAGRHRPAAGETLD
jgi:serine/threonine-protein kinase